MLRKLGSLLKTAEGNVTILFALAAVPLLLAAGAALDYVRVVSARTELQAALDGAALAAAMATDLDGKEREKAAKKYFDKNFSLASKSEYRLDVKVTATSIVATASYELPTSLMAIAGLTQSEIESTSEVQRAKGSTAEVVLVLDYSLSMEDNSKYSRMAQAAADMVDSLSSTIGAEQVKFGLVPFSAMVYGSMPAQFVTQSAAGATWTGCTQDRKSPLNATVTTPDASDASTKWGYIENSKQTTGSMACAAYASKNLKILPLTSDIAAVKAKLKSMVPLGYTNIALGAEFGWNLLDPAAPYSEGAAYDNAKNRKYLILLTDGMQTTNEWGPGNKRSVANAEANLATLCSGMDKAGITVFTIAYDVTDPGITSLLKKCGGDRYYEPSVGGSEITQVFSKINAEIGKQTLRLAR
jgi:Flp pilus assembly protein TadG